MSLIIRPVAECRIDVPTVSEANNASSAHWVKRYKRSKLQINTVIFSMRSQLSAWGHVELPLSIVLVRRSGSPKPLDDDNLPTSMKHVQDGVTDALGMYLPPGRGPRRMGSSRSKVIHFDDRDRLSWSYRQTINDSWSGVVVRMYRPGSMAAALVDLAAKNGVDALVQWMHSNATELDRILP